MKTVCITDFLACGKCSYRIQYFTEYAVLQVDNISSVFVRTLQVSKEVVI